MKELGSVSLVVLFVSRKGIGVGRYLETRTFWVEEWSMGWGL